MDMDHKTLTDFFEALGYIGVAVIGWMIKQAIQNLTRTINRFDRTMSSHELRISKLEWKQREKKNGLL